MNKQQEKIMCARSILLDWSQSNNIFVEQLIDRLSVLCVCVCVWGLRGDAAVSVRHEVRHPPDDSHSATYGVPLRCPAAQDGLLSQTALVRRQAGRPRHVRQHAVSLRRWGRWRHHTWRTVTSSSSRSQRTGTPTFTRHQWLWFSATKASDDESQ